MVEEQTYKRSKFSDIRKKYEVAWLNNKYITITNYPRYTKTWRMYRYFQCQNPEYREAERDSGEINLFPIH